jgi:hypothetical protein
MTRRNIYLIEIIGDPSRTTTPRDCSRLDRQTSLSTFDEPKAFFPALVNRLPSWADGPGYRDRPMSFQWRSPLGLVETLGLPTTRNAAYEVTANYQRQREAERLRLQQRFLSGADCGWARIEEFEDLFCRRNGRAFRIARGKDKRWKLYRVASVADAGVSPGELPGTSRR